MRVGEAFVKWGRGGVKLCDCRISCNPNLTILTVGFMIFGHQKSNRIVCDCDICRQPVQISPSR